MSVPGIDGWQRIASSLCAIGAIVLLSKLYATGLIKVYRWFACNLCFGVVMSVLLMRLRHGSNLYAVVWACTKPLEWMLYLAVILEIYSLVMSRYPGIASMMRWAVTAAAGVSFVLCVLSLSLDFQNPNEKFPILRAAFAVQRTVSATMVISLLAPLFFMARFPVVLARNVVVHCTLFAGFVGVGAVGLFVRNRLGQEYNSVTNLAMSLASDVCLLGWILFLNPAGERVRQPVGPRCSAETEQRLLEQLRGFNEVLIRGPIGGLGARRVGM